MLPDHGRASWQQDHKADVHFASVHSENGERSKSVLYLFSSFSSVLDDNLWNDTPTFNVGHSLT